MYQLNIIIFINLIVMAVQFLLMSQAGTRAWLHSKHDRLEYLFPKFEQPIDIELYVLKALGSFYLIFNLLIPLDLAVNIILVKMFYTIYVEQDAEFVDLEKSIEQGEGKLVGCSVRNMTKLEDVAQIDHIFCDKTGTLTQNKLIFKYLVFGAKKFELDQEQAKEYAKRVTSHLDELESSPAVAEKYLDLWRCICICHDVIQINQD